MTGDAAGKTPDRAWIAARIPHQGAMCLLERVVDWDEDFVVCEAVSHRSPANPLRAEGRLAAVCGIEYAAQAMAVHGALRAQTGERPRMGYLASVRKLTLEVERLDDVAGPLVVEARRMGSEESNVLYAFEVRDAERVLLAGRAAVMLDVMPPA